MGTITKIITIDDEDILNLKNATKALMELSTPHKEYMCEVLTLRSIIDKWESLNQSNNKVVKVDKAGVEDDSDEQ